MSSGMGIFVFPLNFTFLATDIPLPRIARHTAMWQALVNGGNRVGRVAPEIKIAIIPATRRATATEKIIGVNRI